MARLPSDSFLPSGAVEDSNSQHYLTLPTGSPFPLPPNQRHAPKYIPALASPNGRQFFKPYVHPSIQPSTASHQVSPQSHTSSDPQNGPPFSPPATRSASTDESTASLVEDWRAYTSNLREQAKGERAHMAADRARMEECMNEERALWERERDLLKARIAQLESQLAELQISQDQQRREQQQHQQPPPEKALPPAISNGLPSGFGTHNHVKNADLPESSGTDNILPKLIPQESGRNPDGSPFYAPAPQNPSRTFDTTQTEELRVDNMPAPRETPFRVTSRELTQSDFGPQSPPAETRSREESVVGDSIDISQIQPELDGVAIKASAVSPTFAAKVLSPNSSLSPSKTSPSIVPPPRPRNNDDVPSITGRKQSTLEVIAAPENRRLTLHAGHTPNHSVTNFDFSESGNATPKQIQHAVLTETVAAVAQHYDGAIDEGDDADPELQGPLGLNNNPQKDEKFLAALTSKLEEVKESVQISSGTESTTDLGLLKDALNILGRSSVEGESDSSDLEAIEDSKVPEAPKLRMKASTNFGRPFGSL